MLRAALNDAEKRTVQQQAQTKGIGAALGLLGGLLQAARERYRALGAKIEREEQKEEAAWEAWKSRSQTLAAQRAEQQRQQAAAAYQAYRQGERAEPPKTPTPTATLTPVKPPTPPPTPPMSQGTPTPTATPAPMKTPLPDPFPLSPVPACTLPPTPQIPIGASPEKFVVTKGIGLKGGPGSPISYASSAEETYTGHSYGGNAPAADRIGLLNDILVWIRDNTPLLDRVFPPEVNGVIFYQPKVFEPVIALEPPPGFPRNPFLPQPGSVLIPGGTGISITGVQIENHGGEVLGIQSVGVDLHPVNSNQSYRSILAYPFDYLIITSSEFNVVQPGDIFRLHIDPVDVPPESAAKVTIHVRSESGRYGSIVQEIVP